MDSIEKKLREERYRRVCSPARYKQSFVCNEETIACRCNVRHWIGTCSFDINVIITIIIIITRNKFHTSDCENILRDRSKNPFNGTQIGFLFFLNDVKIRVVFFQRAFFVHFTRFFVIAFIPFFLGDNTLEIFFFSFFRQPGTNERRRKHRRAFQHAHSRGARSLAFLHILLQNRFANLVDDRIVLVVVIFVVYFRDEDALFRSRKWERFP